MQDKELTGPGRIPENMDEGELAQIADESQLDYRDEVEDGRSVDMEEVDESLLDDDPTNPVAQPPLASTTQKPSKERSVPKPAVEGKKMRVFSSLANSLNNTHIGYLEDDVFKPVAAHPPPHGPAVVIGSDCADFDQGKTQPFPPIYNVIRANKNQKLGATQLGGAFGYNRVHSQSHTGYKGGLAAAGDMRSFKVQNFHSTEKGFNCSFSISRPEGGGDPMNCLGCSSAHSFAERLGDGLPVLVIIADQSFSPFLPAKEGLCPIVIRVEDGTLQDLCEVFLDRFRAFTLPNGAFPPGSVIALGSLTHLRARGLEDYTESWVSSAFRLGAKVGQNVETIPLVCIPLHSIADRGLIRDLFDFDCWLAATQQPVSTPLMGTREIFWQAVKEGQVPSEGGGGGVPGTEPYNDAPHQPKKQPEKGLHQCPHHGFAAVQPRSVQPGAGRKGRHCHDHRDQRGIRTRAGRAPGPIPGS